MDIEIKKREITSLFRDPAGIRTPDPQLRRLLLYPAELRDHHIFSNSRAKVLLFFEMCKFFVFIFFACAQGLRGKKTEKTSLS